MMDTPDYQYELLEDIANAGWAAAFPEWVNPTENTTPEEFSKAVDAWLAFMEAASVELHKRGWKIAIPTKAVA